MAATEERTTNNVSELADRQAYAWAALTLRAGMYASFALMIVGLLWWIVAGSPSGQGSVGHGFALDRLLPELLQGNPLAVLNLGLLLLLATPALTLLAQIIAFVAERNLRYAAIAGLIGLILLVSITVSALGLDKAFQSWLVDLFKSG